MTRNDASKRHTVQIPEVVTKGPPPLAPGFRILLVDDSEADQILMVAFLKRLRCVIDIAGNGQRGVELFQNGHYDLVLMDVEMPVMGGQEAVREIRRIEKETDALPVPVLALTAHTLANVAAKAYEAGFTDLLSKPIRRETLLAAVATYGPEPAPASSQVQVEDEMEDLVPAYLERRRGDVAACRLALEAGDFDVIRRLGHNMKGTGSGYGFPGLTELGAEIETAALRSDISAIRKHLEHFADYLEHVESEHYTVAGGSAPC